MKGMLISLGLVWIFRILMWMVESESSVWWVLFALWCLSVLSWLFCATKVALKFIYGE